ncbi:SUMO-activating enzyme subunit 1 [Planococcus citri]|uniref:SUMO-activating enzyme subunit 1 n=1 Tax=Planococcus citri TaxID=170843 RepID=UPI0031F85805
MNASDQNSITEEEAELYDRQIRLWGANVQRSLRNTRVLVIGMKGVAGEVCKNLILSGVKSVTMMDHENVSKSDLHSQYLLHPESVGENRAKASLKAAQVLNPNVKVTAETSSPLELKVSYYSNFDVVCATSQSNNVYVCLNDICKLYQIKFYCGDSFGMFGYLFEDLNDGKTAEKTRNATSFQTAVALKWIPKTSAKKRKQEDPSYVIFKILSEFRTVNGRNPSRDVQNDYQQLLESRTSILKKLDLESDILPLEYLENIYGEYGPTCSIIGGMIAQQVVKSLSKEEPSSSYIYFFNHLRCQLSGVSLNQAVTALEKDADSKLCEQDFVEL